MSLRHPQYSHPGPRPKRFYRNSNPRIAAVSRDLYFVGKLKQHEIAWLFGVSQHTVSRWISGQVWAQR